MFVLLILFFLSFLLLEGTITTLPLVLIFLLCFAIIKRGSTVFILALFAGIFLDSMTMHPLGVTSIFFILFLFLVLLYERKYEIASYPFVIVSSFLGTLLYLIIFGYRDVLVQAIICSFIAVASFSILKRRKTSEEFSI